MILKNKLTNKELKDQHGFNALYYATFYGHKHIIEELGKKEVPYEPSNEGTTCLHIACKKGYLDVVNYFLNYKTLQKLKAHHPWDGNINVNARKEHKKGMGYTPAFLAAKNGHIEIFKLLSENGAKIENFKCSIGGNQDLDPIHIASKYGHSEIVNFIISKSQNI